MDESSELNKKKMMDCYRQQVNGTENLYQDVGYFMRMRFWDPINKLKDKIRFTSNSSHDASAEEIYTNLLLWMNRYIEATGERQVSTENINNMIFNRNMIRAKYANKHLSFVEKLNECIEREEEIIKKCLVEDIDLPEIPQADEIPMQDRGNTHGLLGASAQFNESSNLSPHFDMAFLDSIISDFDLLKQLKEQHLSTKYSDSLFEGVNYKSSPQIDIGIFHLRNKEVEMKKLHLYEALEKSILDLEHIKKKYEQLQSLMDVKQRPQEDLENSIKLIFQRFSCVLAELFKDSDFYHSKLDSIIERVVKMSVIMQKNPQECVFLENEKRGEKTAAESSGAKTASTKKKERTFCTKKMEFISASLIIVGAPYLTNLYVKEKRVELVTEENEKCGELITSVQSNNSEINFSEIKIQGYQRRGSGNIYRQYVRLKFWLKVSCFDKDYEVEARSLPFYLCTGAVQVLELIGARMWLCCSNEGNMYSNVEFKDEIPSETFLDMLDNRIKSISPHGGRGLSFSDRQGLLTMVQKKKGKGKYVSLHSFVKDKLDKEFCFFTWFYAAVNTIETCMLQPWNDGFVYQFLIRSGEAEQVLLADNIPLNTALIRPGTSSVLKPTCTDAQIKFVVEVKVLKNDEVKVKGMPVEKEFWLRHGLYGGLKNIKNNDDKQILKYVLTCRGDCLSLDELKKYNKINGASVFEYHKATIVTNVIYKFQPDSTDNSCSAPASKSSKIHEQDNYTPRRRKISKRCSISAANSPATSASSPSTCFDSPSTCLDSPMSFDNEMASPGLPPPSLATFSPRVNDFNSNATEASSQENMNPTSGQPESQGTEQQTLVQMGGCVVDVSKISDYKPTAIKLETSPPGMLRSDTIDEYEEDGNADNNRINSDRYLCPVNGATVANTSGDASALEVVAHGLLGQDESYELLCNHTANLPMDCNQLAVGEQQSNDNEIFQEQSPMLLPQFFTTLHQLQELDINFEDFEC